MIPVKKLNHAVLYVSDLNRSVKFYCDLFGFQAIAQEGPMAFLRAKDSANHHDLGLFALGSGAKPAPRGSTGLYHLAWEISNIQELAKAREVLIKAGAYTGESDHGATKSVYGTDPDNNQFELMVLLPRERWGQYDRHAPVMPLDWEKELKDSNQAS